MVGTTATDAFGMPSSVFSERVMMRRIEPEDLTPHEAFEMLQMDPFKRAAQRILNGERAVGITEGYEWGITRRLLKQVVS